MPKYPDAFVDLDLTGPGGNAFAIMGNVSKELKRLGVSKEERDEYQKDATSDDYDHLLDVTREWVTTVD